MNGVGQGAVRKCGEEAYDAGMAPPVFLEAIHSAALEWIELGELRQHAAV